MSSQLKNQHSSMTGLTPIEPVGSFDRTGPAKIALWAFIPAYLLLHGIVATCLPQSFAPLSTLFIVLPELIAVAVCINAWRDNSDRGTFWLLLIAAILVHSAAMSLDAAEEMIHAPVLNHVPGIQIFLSMLSGVPLLFAISIQNDRRTLRPAQIIHGAMSIAIGALIYFEIFKYLTVYGSWNQSDEVVVTHLFDAIDLFLAAAGTIRWLGSSEEQERRFFRLLSAFLWMNTIFPAIHNRILMHHDYVWLDLLISAPYVVLIPLDPKSTEPHRETSVSCLCQGRSKRESDLSCYRACRGWIQHGSLQFLSRPGGGLVCDSRLRHAQHLCSEPRD